MNHLSIVTDNIGFIAFFGFLLLLGLSYVIGEKLRRYSGKRQEQKEREYFEGKTNKPPVKSVFFPATQKKGGNKTRTMRKTEQILFRAYPNLSLWHTVCDPMTMTVEQAEEIAANYQKLRADKHSAVSSCFLSVKQMLKKYELEGKTIGEQKESESTKQ